MAISKSTIKYLRSLSLKKFRQKYNNFIVEGDKMARELLTGQPGRVVALYALGSWLEQAGRELPLPKEKAFVVAEQELARISNLSTPNQVLAVVSMPENRVEEEPLRNGLSLFLDGIQDPGNFGTILRIADWFGISFVFCSPTCVDPYNPKAIQASMGAFLRVKVVEQSLENLCLLAPGLPVYGAAMDGENVFQARLPAKGIIVIGNEGNGISAAAAGLLNRRIAIPAAAHGGAESLNAAVAAGIICAVFRNRM